MIDTRSRPPNRPEAHELPLVLDLFAGLGGWSQPARDAGFRTLGIDAHNLGFPGELIQDWLPWPDERILALRPSLILASPPCEHFARQHLPFRSITRPPAVDLEHSRQLLEWSIGLARRLPVPVVVECSRFAVNHVRGWRLWGSYALWGAVPALLPQPVRGRKSIGRGGDPRRALIPYELAEAVTRYHLHSPPAHPLPDRPRD